MVGRNANIYFPEATYNKLKQVAGTKISRFVSEAVEEKIRKEEQRKKTEFNQKLVADYQSVAKSKKIQKEYDIRHEVNECDCEGEDTIRYLRNRISELESRVSSAESNSSSQLVLRRNTETERNDLQVTKRNLESRNYDLERERNSLQSILSDKEVKRITDSFNALQIESNNKDNEIKTKEEKNVSLQVRLGEAEEDILKQELITKEKKLAGLTRSLELEPKIVEELREVYERLIKAREDYNRDGVVAAQRDIDTRKQELLQTDISVDNLYKVYRNCEKVAEVRIKLEKIHEQRFEARQEVSTNN
ncbi:12992_t:CDS:2 [Funneliformis geosporum]|nr:12992_t:CDS:2 [Funneliformis geosporum]